MAVQKLHPSPEVQNFQVSLTHNKLKLYHCIINTSLALSVFGPEHYIMLETTVINTTQQVLSVKVAPFSLLK